MKQLLFLALCICSHCISFSQTLTDEEKKIYNYIMAYRAQNNLPNIPLSPSLTIVAQTHVKDLAMNKPDLGSCNAHSWSGNGNWKPVCYTADHKQASLMWSKPKELTSYQGNGFEIAAGSNGCCSNFVMTAEYAVEGWKKSSGHNAVMINQDVWKTLKWNAIGIGLYKGFAVVWFGEQLDNAANPVETKEPVKVKEPAMSVTAKDSILQMASSLSKDLSLQGPKAWLQYFENSPSFFMAAEGELQFSGYESARKEITNNLARSIRRIGLQWKDMQVQLLANGLASVQAGFRSDDIGFDGTKKTYDGYFTGTAHLTATGWKLLNLHWSMKP
jgi:hypothetical protein